MCHHSPQSNTEFHRACLLYTSRLGTKALNFTYTLDSGAKGTLYQFPAEYTLLFINNPGCHACSEMIEGLKSSPVINGFIADKKLKVLSLYPDEELDEWKKHRSDFAKEWTNGYDKELVIKNKNLYDLRAIPTLYLLAVSYTHLDVYKRQTYPSRHSLTLRTEKVRTRCPRSSPFISTVTATLMGSAWLLFFSAS